MDKNNNKKKRKVPADDDQWEAKYAPVIGPGGSTAAIPAASAADSLSLEMYRLQVLKSYAVLDTQDPALDRLTTMATRFFGTTFSTISLVDVTDIHILSNAGFGPDLKQVPRKGSFCAHVINADDIFCIPDTLKDERFATSAFVANPPHVRFYCGTPLISPEGYKIGSFCVLGTDPRTDVATKDEQATLIDLAQMAVRLLVDRRFQNSVQSKQKTNKLLACSTSHDVMTPLTGLQMSLSLLQDDRSLVAKMDDGQVELVTTASSCANVMTRIFQSTMDHLRNGGSSTASSMTASSSSSVASSSSAKSSSSRMEKDNSSFPERTGALRKLTDFVNCLYKVLAPIPKKVPVMIDVDPKAPSMICVDDLKVFRAALNVLSAACARTVTGFVRLRIVPVQGAELLFECQDTAPPISQHDKDIILKKDNSSSVASISSDDDDDFDEPVLMSIRYAASLITSITGGKIGLIQANNEKKKKTNAVWFRIPDNTFGQTPVATIAESKDRQVSVPTILNTSASITSQVVPPDTRKDKCALIIDDSLVVRKILGRSLARLGYNVSLAEDGFQGLEYLQKQIYDVVLLDFLMPVMDGMDCVKQFRKWEERQLNDTKRRTQRQVIVGISAHASLADSKAGVSAGMDAFESKPITLKTLKRIVIENSTPIVEDTTAPVVTMTENPTGAAVIPQQESREQASSSRNQAPVTDVDAAKATSACRKRERSAVYDEICKKRLLSTSGSEELENDTPEEISMNKASATAFEAPKTSTTSSSPSSPRHMLIATTSNCSVSASLIDRLEQEGWTCQIVWSGQTALELLKLRNWDAVLVDNESAGFDCLQTFRKWELQNRIHRQQNVFWINKHGKAEQKMHAPEGMDGVLHCQATVQEFTKLVEDNAQRSDKTNFIITR